MTSSSHRWPVLTTYRGAQLARVALPLGGIGTGTVSLAGNGALRDWEIMNRPAKGYVPWSQGAWPGLVLRLRPRGGAPVLRALEGPMPDLGHEGPTGATEPNHGWPRFRSCRFAAAYPLGQVSLADPDVPVRATLQAFNPFVPCDPEKSGLPVAIVRIRLTNVSSRPLEASVCANLPNVIGADGYALRRDAWSGRMEPAGARGNRNRFRRGAGYCGLFGDSRQVPSDAEAWGTLALATTAPQGVSFRTAWADRAWGMPLLDFHDDLLSDGALDDRRSRHDCPVASLCVQLRLPARRSREVTFLLAWHFPHRRGWGPDSDSSRYPVVGNHYATRFQDAWEVVRHVAPRLEALERRTMEFVRTVVESTLPHAFKEAALANLAALRSQTCFRTADGRFWGWEGCHDRQGSCWGNCTHVWNYEYAVPYLFGSLARSMRETDFGAVGPDGFMPFRHAIAPLERPFGTAAADGQMGTVLRLFREWQLSGDDAFLRRLWPAARRALEFGWRRGGWDADRDGVMEGCQHNTMDVEYYGPNPQMASWYLAALQAAAAMADALGETEFAGTCARLAERGARWIERHLFNGDYFEHQVRPPPRGQAPDPRLVSGMGSAAPRHPGFQIGPGCLIDQLAGLPTAILAGLAPGISTRAANRALSAVLRHNRRRPLWGHFNFFRTFAGGDESALVMCAYPQGRRPAEPFPYASEVMTGFEYCVAVHLLLEGREADALAVVRDVRARYDGRRRNPFDEAECGHHYVRAMASWGLIPAATGFRYSAVSGRMAFARPPAAVRWFWSTGEAWGEVRLQTHGGAVRGELRCRGGRLRLRQLAVTGVGDQSWEAERVLEAGESVRVRIGREAAR